MGDRPGKSEFRGIAIITPFSFMGAVTIFGGLQLQLERMAEILQTSQLRYPELERLKMLEESDQLEENEPQ